MSDPIEVSFGNWIKQRRRDVGIVQAELADQIGCALTTLQKMESGERRPSRQIAVLLASYFGVPDDEQEAFVTFARAHIATPAAIASTITLRSGAAEASAKVNSSTTAPWRAVHLRKSNLPRSLTLFSGREQEEDAICALLTQSSVRLFTLTGPPGTGKTRMAIEVATTLLGHFEDGVFLAELAPVSDPDMVIPSIARTLGLWETGGHSGQSGNPIDETLLAYIKDKRILLVLDNFEHLLDAGPEVVKLVQASPWLKILVTSREALHVRGERHYPVPPLRLPILADNPSLEELAHNPAVELFVERAHETDGDFVLTNENAGDVAGVCINLDGLPLAIELAAARVSVFPPQTLLSRLGRQLKVLTGGQRDLPPRQRTLRGAIDWSYDLLDEAEQDLLRRMSIFEGGSTREALDTLCSYDKEPEVDVADWLQSLLSKNLLKQRQGAGGEPRFWMLETIHEYAKEKLEEIEEAEELRRWHAKYFLTFAERVEPLLTGPEQVKWLNTLDDEHNNLRAALRWARDAAEVGAGAGAGAGTEAIEIGLRIGGAIWRFWGVRGYLSEGLAYLRQLLEMQLTMAAQVVQASYAYQEEEASQSQAQPSQFSRTLVAARAKALNGAGNLAFSQGDTASILSLHEESLALSREIGDKRGIVSSLHTLGLVAQHWRGDYAAARSLFEESLALSREIGDKRGIGYSLNNLGDLAHHAQEDYASARSLHEESLTLFREIGDNGAIGWSLNELAAIDTEQGDYASARSLHEESLTLFREIGDKRSIGHALSNLGRTAQEQGDCTFASTLVRESLALFREIGDKWGTSYALGLLGLVAQGQGDYASARSLHEESLTLFRDMGNKEQSCRSLNNLGLVIQEQGDYASARSLYEESLAMSRELENKWSVAVSLSGLGGLAVVRADSVENLGNAGHGGVAGVEHGTRLLGAAEGLVEIMGVVLYSNERVPHALAVASARALLGEEAFEKAWQEGRAMSMQQAIEYALHGCR